MLQMANLVSLIYFEAEIYATYTCRADSSGEQIQQEN
jgi:hypothetical protein